MSTSEDAGSAGGSPAPDLDGPVPSDLGELILFVNGASDLSGRAIANARHLCDTQLHGRYQLSVIDVQEDPAAVIAHTVLATPTLARTRPLPLRKFVGDLSRTDQVLRTLGLVTVVDAATGEG